MPRPFAIVAAVTILAGILLAVAVCKPSFGAPSDAEGQQDPAGTPAADSAPGRTFDPGRLKPGPARSGPITVERSSPLVGGSVDLKGGRLTIRDGGTVDGVDIFNGPNNWGAVDITGNFTTLKNSVIHDSRDAGVVINSQGKPGQRFAVITDNVFRDLGDDAVHVIGTNRGDGQAPSFEMAQVGHLIARNLSERTGTRDRRRSWSFEIQDGCRDIVMEDNRADNTFSLAGHTNLTFVRNTVTATTQVWGFEFGNQRGSLWEENLATTTGRFVEAFAFTGRNADSNVGNTIRGNAVHHAESGFPLALGRANTFADNCFSDVRRWRYAKDRYDARDDVVTNDHECP